MAEAFQKTGGVGGAAVFGSLRGSIVFYVGDALDRMGGADRKSSSGEQAAGSRSRSSSGSCSTVPESIVLGLTLVGGGVSVAMLVAVFLSNLPEAVAADGPGPFRLEPEARDAALARRRARDRALSSLAGFALFDEASDDAVAFVLAFAAGAILTMLADTMMPEAFEHGGSSWD